MKKKQNPAVESQQPAPGGVISANEAYSLEQVKARLGLGACALRTARRKGLSVRRIGRRSFVLGSDLLDYIENHATLVV